MTGHEFIFSSRKKIRFLRHLTFWTSCWLYGSMSYYIIQQSGLTSGFNPKYVSPGAYVLLKTFLLIFVYTIPCYTFIYSILPSFIDRKWLKALAVFLPLVFLMYGLGWLMYWKLFPFVDSIFGLTIDHQYPTRFWPAIVLGFIDPLKIIAAAAIIKYLKYWWLRQGEKEQLEQEKLSAELQLLKAQISPGFLFTTLDNIYEYALSDSPRTPELLMKLSDLLSYMVYECEVTFVPLEKEIILVKDFLLLKELSLNDNIEMGITVTGDMTEKLIAPFLVLSFIESGLKHCGKNSEQAWINIDMSVNNDFFVMKLAGSVKASDEDIEHELEGDLTDVQKRLSLLYPQKHELKISRESEMFIVLLKIRTVPELEKMGDISQFKPSLA